MLMRYILIFALLATWTHGQSTEEAATTEGGDDGGSGDGEGSGDGSGDGGTTEAEQTTIPTTKKSTKRTTVKTTKQTTLKVTTPNNGQTTMEPSSWTINGSSLPQLPNQPQATETPQQVLEWVNAFLMAWLGKKTTTPSTQTVRPTVSNGNGGEGQTQSGSGYNPGSGGGGSRGGIPIVPGLGRPSLSSGSGGQSQNSNRNKYPIVPPSYRTVNRRYMWGW